MLDSDDELESEPVVVESATEVVPEFVVLPSPDSPGDGPVDEVDVEGDTDGPAVLPRLGPVDAPLSVSWTSEGTGEHPHRATKQPIATRPDLECGKFMTGRIVPGNERCAAGGGAAAPVMGDSEPRHQRPATTKRRPRRAV
ncbi:MAG: hypothetical protein AAF799_40325, partial [Myxococcota bacterium]